MKKSTLILFVIYNVLLSIAVLFLLLFHYNVIRDSAFSQSNSNSGKVLTKIKIEAKYTDHWSATGINEVIDFAKSRNYFQTCDSKNGLITIYCFANLAEAEQFDNDLNRFFHHCLEYTSISSN